MTLTAFSSLSREAHLKYPNYTSHKRSSSQKKEMKVNLGLKSPFFL